VKKRQLLIGVGVLAVLVVVLLVFGPSRNRSRGVGRRAGMLVAPGFVPAEARLIKITRKGTEQVRVRKGPEGWTVESAWGYPAVEAKVNALLQAIEQLRIREVRSTRRTSHPELEVDEATGIWVRVLDADGTELANVCAGKSISRERCFVRTAGSDEVAEATPNLVGATGAGASDRKPRQKFFVTMRVTHFDEKAVRRVRLERESGTVVLEATEGVEQVVNPTTGQQETKPVIKWVFREPETDAGQEADSAACHAIVQGLAAMTAFDIGGPRTLAVCGLAPPKATVTFEFEGADPAANAAPVTVLFGEPETEENRYYAMMGGQGARIFIISPHYWGLATKPLDELRKARPEAPADGAGEAAKDESDEAGKGPSDSENESEESPPETS